MQVEHGFGGVVVCSREVKEGPDCSRWCRSEDAVSLVQLAQEFIEIMLVHAAPSGRRLYAKIGV